MAPNQLVKEKKEPTLSSFRKGLYKCLHWFFQRALFFWPWYKWFPAPLGLIPLIIHRALLEEDNLHPAPLGPQTPIDESTIKYPHKRPDNGYGTDLKNPEAAMDGAPFGRNCRTILRGLRKPEAHPTPQYLSEMLLARKVAPDYTFADNAGQFNIIAAAWIQAMVHDWIGHFDDNRPGQGVTLDKGGAGCPLKKFNFRKTLERTTDDHEFDSFRTNWWDASFVYGQDKEAVKAARTFEGGRMKVNPKFDAVLPQSGEDPTLFTTGDNKNSWLGVELLQELFLREHNRIAEAIAIEKDDWSDDDLFGAARLVVAALVAKIHTVDWTVELLKTTTLRVGMKTNWYGLPIALIGKRLSKWLKLKPYFRLVQKEKADNKNVPFCLTEEFAAVYRLHPLLPDYIEVDGKFIELEEMVGQKVAHVLTHDIQTGEEVKPGKDNPVPRKFWKSFISYPSGALTLHNYPVALRDLAPTTDEGVELKDRVDLAAIDIYRDRERGIPKFNDFRRDLGLTPYRNFKHLTGNVDPEITKLLETAYPKGIEDLDLLIGDLAEKKIKGFAISETSFVIFLLMASRRLDADPFLNEYYTEENYTKTGLDWLENTSTLREVLERNYEHLMEDLNLPKGKSAFTPTKKTPPRTDKLGYGTFD